MVLMDANNVRGGVGMEDSKPAAGGPISVRRGAHTHPPLSELVRRDGTGAVGIDHRKSLSEDSERVFQSRRNICMQRFRQGVEGLGMPHCINDCTPHL